jgi:polyisoprenoid-binding protein YceI
MSLNILKLKWALLCGLASLVGGASLGHAATYDVVQGSKVQFLAKITGSSFRAGSSEIVGRVELDEAGTRLVSASFRVKADSLDTGVSLRNQHMNETYLEVKEFPWITFEASDQGVASGGGQSSEVVGYWLLHGVRREATLKLVVKKKSETELVLGAAFPLNILDYNIKQPRFTVVKMKPVVKVKVNLVLRKQ